MIQKTTKYINWLKYGLLIKIYQLINLKMKSKTFFLGSLKSLKGLLNAKNYDQEQDSNHCPV